MVTSYPLDYAMSLKNFYVCKILWGWFIGFLVFAPFACGQLNQQKVLEKQSQRNVAPVLTNKSKANRALIVTISHYQHNRQNSGLKGWSDLSSSNDLTLMEEVLRYQEFQDIRILKDQEATKEAIKVAWRNLLEDSDDGDTLVFHFSGHGQQVTDQGILDEPDGYDEAIVPYDAPMTQDQNYTGEKHLRDDEFNVLLNEARHAVGPHGHVVVWVDACYSGSIGRGEARRRGADFPLGKPHPDRSQIASKESLSGIIDEGIIMPVGGVGQKTTDAPAPYVIFSASAYNIEAKETHDRDRDYLPVGSLSYGLSQALGRVAITSTYQNLFEDVSWAMRANGVPNTPQSEGNLNLGVFNGRVAKYVPYFSVKEVPNDQTVWINGGFLLGVSRKSIIEFSCSRTCDPNEDPKLGEGEVVLANPTSAKIILKKAIQPEKLLAARAIVKQYNYGGTGIIVKFEEEELEKNSSGPIEHLKKKFKERLQQLKVNNVKILDSGPSDLTIRLEKGRHIQVERTDSGTIILGPLDYTRSDLLDVIGNRVQDFALNRYFQNLEIKSPSLDVDFEIVPVQLTSCQNPQRPRKKECIVTPMDQIPLYEAGRPIYRVGDTFVIKVYNRGPVPVNVAILDLIEDGTIESVWQPYQQTDKQKIPDNSQFELPPIYFFKKAWKSETFLFIATNEWVNTDLVVTPPHEQGLQPQTTYARGGLIRGTLGPLDPISQRNARVGTYYDPQFVQTRIFQFTVLPAS